MSERLQKIIARAGLASRRSAEELIVAGRVRVNGVVVSELGAKADPLHDKVEVDGRRLIAETLHYVVLHKPRNVVSTLSDPEGRPTVATLLRDQGVRLYPVGRLDFATSGVLLATNDGEFANGLLHPKGGVPKTYVVKTSGIMREEDLELWRQGVQLEDGMTRPAEVRLLRHEGDKTWLELTLREGKNQQIRRMGEATRFPVMRLARVSFAGVTHEGLRPGDSRALTSDELLAIKKQFGVPKRIPRGGAPIPVRPRDNPLSAERAPRPSGSPAVSREYGPRSAGAAPNPRHRRATNARSLEHQPSGAPARDERRAPRAPSPESAPQRAATARREGPARARPPFKSGRSGRS